MEQTPSSNDISPDVVVIKRWDEVVAPAAQGGQIATYGGAVSPIAGDLRSPNFKSGSAGWLLDSNGNLEANNGNFRGDITGATGTFSGTVSGGALDIGGDDATSAHIDSTGNFWTGANIAGYATAPARISNAGAAHFENVTIGGSTIQYVITNSGIFSFGDGSDSSATCDGSTAVAGMSRVSSTYTLTRDVYFTTLTVNNGVTIDCAGYRIFCSVSLSNAGTIQRNGAVGNGGGGGFAVGNGGAGGSARTLADGYLKGSGPTGAGGNGGNDGAAGQNAGAVTAVIANWHLATLLDISSSGATVKFTAGANAAGGGGGGGDGSPDSDSAGGGGGGGGTGGGMVAIYAKSITNTGTISSNGGIGGDGGDGRAGNAGGNKGGNGGGGAGGNGGVVVLVYNTITNSGSITVTAGTGGLGGGLAGAGKSAANSGSAGTIYQFQLSL